MEEMATVMQALAGLEARATSPAHVEVTFKRTSAGAPVRCVLGLEPRTGRVVSCAVRTVQCAFIFSSAPQAPSAPSLRA